MVWVYSPEQRPPGISSTLDESTGAVNHPVTECLVGVPANYGPLAGLGTPYQRLATSPQQYNTEED